MREVHDRRLVEPLCAHLADADTDLTIRLEALAVLRDLHRVSVADAEPGTRHRFIVSGAYEEQPVHPRRVAVDGEPVTDEDRSIIEDVLHDLVADPDELGHQSPDRLMLGGIDR